MASLSYDRPDGGWVEAGPFRAHLRHLMAAGGLSAQEAGLVTGLSVRAVQHILHGRRGRLQRRICPDTARRLLRVGIADVRSLRWCLTPAGPARTAYQELLAADWTRGQIAAAVRAPLTELDALPHAGHCSRLLAIRLRSLVETLPSVAYTEPGQDLARAA